MSFTVLSPIAGLIVPISEVPDPVFSAGIVGPGVGIAPPPTADNNGWVEVLAPAMGRIMQLHDHAFVLASPTGATILVHLGLDTVSLKGSSLFTSRVEIGQTVQAGQVVCNFDAAGITARGLNPVVIVVGLELPSPAVKVLPSAGTQIAASTPLLELYQ